MSPPLSLTPDSRLVMREISGDRFGDVARQCALIRLIGEVGRLGLVAPESDLDQYRRHVRTAQHREIRLLHTTIRPGMHVDQSRLDRLGQIARFAEMFILSHIGDDEAEWISL